MGRQPQRRSDHRGRLLPAGVYAKRSGKAICAYKVRWREEGRDGVEQSGSKTFSGTACGSLDEALAKAVAFRRQAIESVRAEGTVLRIDPSASMSVEELFQEWCVLRGSKVSERYAERVVSYWEREIGSRRIAKVRLARLSEDPGIITRFQDELIADGLGVGVRIEVLKILRLVLRWGRRRHPTALKVDLGGLFELPRVKRRQLAYAADAIAIERLIEAASNREVREDIHVLRDVAFIAAMGYTVAARPSEWLYSARWCDVHQSSVELQRPGAGDDLGAGLKTGARAALLLSGANLRFSIYRERLEERFGPQPEAGLVFQKLGPEGPLWSEEDGRPVPVGWDFRDYQRWTQRVWRGARQHAAQAPDAPAGLAQMRFYDCRHTAISMALHSTLVIGPHGMSLYNLAGWAGHDVQTLQRYYAHIIARYQGAEPIDLDDECRRARGQIEASPRVERWS